MSQPGNLAASRSIFSIFGGVASSAAALAAARYLLVEARGSQAEFVIPDHLAHAEPVVERFDAWARRRLTKGFSLVDAARAVCASERMPR